MKSISVPSLLFVALLFAAGCSVDVAGAPCETDENCPASQSCVAGTCELGSGPGSKDTGKDPVRDDGTGGDGSFVPKDTGADDTIDLPDSSDASHPPDASDGGTDGSDASDATDSSDGSLPDAGADTGPDAGGDVGDAGQDAGYDGGTCLTENECGGALCCNGTCAPQDRGCCETENCRGNLSGKVCKDLTCQCENEFDCIGLLRICDVSANPPSCVDGCTDAKCGTGNVCCEMDCFKGDCCENADCTAPDKPTCSSNVCTNACGAAAKCGAGYKCCGGTCKKGDCCTNQDCSTNPAGKFCIANKCSQTCSSDSNCQGGKCCQVGLSKGSCYSGDCCDDSQCSAPETCGGGGTEWWCGCTPETKDEFCVRLGKQCGTVTGVDNCGNTRSNVLCGVCSPECLGCVDGQCAAAQHAYAWCNDPAGDVWWWDSCWNPEEVKDKCAENGWPCVNDVCCVPEDDTTFCERLGKECGTLTDFDNCGTARTVASCGLCAACKTCQAGICTATSHATSACDGSPADVYWFDSCGVREDLKQDCGASQVCTGDFCCTPDSTVCAGKQCGSVIDNCGETIVCGMCPMDWDCCDFTCFDVRVDRLHCGDCVTQCAFDEICNGGVCRPKAWDGVGGAVNPANAGLAHALGTDGTGAIVAWVGQVAGLDGGAGLNSVFAHQFSGAAWSQLGGVVSGLDIAQPVVDIQVAGGHPHVVYADGGISGKNVHLKIFSGATSTWDEVGPAGGYVPPCMVLSSIALAPQNFSGQPNITLLGSGGCGIGVGYTYLDQNTNSWWDTPNPPAPMKGLLTMNGAGNSDVVHDGTKALVAHADSGSFYVRYWSPSVQPPPGAWLNLGGALNGGPIPAGAGSGPPMLSIALNPGKQPIVAYVENVNNVKTVFVKAYDSFGGVWITLGGGRVSGAGPSDSPSLAMVDGLPYVAYVQMEGTVGTVQVRRWNGQEWQRVGSSLTMDVFSTPEAPYIVGVGKVPYVAFRQKDGVDAARIYVAKFVAP